MDYITQIFQRADLQHIREFLLHGVNCTKVSDQSYKQRLESSANPVFDMIEEKFSEKEIDHMAELIHHHATVTQDVYFEIGMQCGAMLMEQLLQHKSPHL